MTIISKQIAMPNLVPLASCSSTPNAGIDVPIVASMSNTCLRPKDMIEDTIAWWAHFLFLYLKIQEIVLHRGNAFGTLAITAISAVSVL